MPEICAVNYIDHVGVAVNDIQAALEFFGANFGAPDAEVVELDDQAVRACLIEIGQTRLELLEPLSPESAVGRFIERRGEGLHHLALNVDDIAGKLKILSANGLSLIDSEPRHGLSGFHRFRPSSLGVWRADRAGRKLTTRFLRVYRWRGRGWIGKISTSDWPHHGHDFHFKSDKEVSGWKSVTLRRLNLYRGA